MGLSHIMNHEALQLPCMPYRGYHWYSSARRLQEEGEKQRERQREPWILQPDPEQAAAGSVGSRY